MTEKMRYRQRLLEMRAQKDILIASHRGTIGVAIADNTIESFDIALNQGAAILEMDIAMTLDDQLFVIHDGMESRLLHTDQNVQSMTGEQLLALRYYSLNHTRLQRGVCRFDDVLEHLKNRCMINLDRCWVHPNEARKWSFIFDAVSRHEMEDQVIFKSPDADKYVKVFSGQSKPYLYMPMAKKPADFEKFIQAGVNVISVEVLFDKSTSPMADPAVYEQLRNRHILVWGNAITLGGDAVLAGYHDDNTSLTGNPDQGWGWFAEQHFDIVQTDWVPAMSEYYTQKGYRV